MAPSALWSLCDLSLVPLRDNPVFATVIPSKIFESMGMGVPILMSLPEGEATAIIRRTGSGVCVPPEDPKALANAIAELSNQPETMVALRATAHAAAPGFSRDTQAALMLNILIDVAAR